MSRSTIYSDEIVKAICERVANGESVNAICKDKSMPSRTTVMEWQRENESFRTSIAHAREDQADYYFDKQIEIAESATIEDYQLRKFQADTFKWVAARMKPRVYGESTQLKHADADGNKLDVVSLVQALDGTSTGLPKIEE